MTSRTLTQMFLALAALVVLAMSAIADPGLPQGPNRVSDQKKGSVLFYNLYASSPTNPVAENTRINITNTNDTDGVFVHFFFVDGGTCSVADNYICLSKSQTTSLLASDVDPGTTGYIVAVATNGKGEPVNFNHLIGDEYVKLASGHAANLAAESVAAIGGLPLAADADMKVTLKFDDAQYDAMPRVLALDSFASPKDGNDTRLIVNRVGGDLRTSAGSIGGIFGLVFDELESGYSFNLSGGCQINRSLSDSFPRTAPRLTNVVPAGSVGWMKFWATADVAMLGSAINLNASPSASSFNGGHNLHKLTWTKAATLTIPVFPTMCN